MIVMPKEENVQPKVKYVGLNTEIRRRNMGPPCPP
jgi:hypothetical protein